MGQNSQQWSSMVSNGQRDKTGLGYSAGLFTKKLENSMYFTLCRYYFVP